MEQIKIHFYKARNGKIGDKIVGLVSVFSHVELEINGVCYSSSNRDKGVRSKVIDTSNAQKWLSFDLKKDIDVNSVYCDIPRGISPNGDTKNDSFDLTNFSVNKLEIFNRYGIKVYTKSGYKNEWDGTSDKGQELPDGTYYYVVEFESGKSKTGWVYLNREH